jgi:hypothetical protein
VAVVLVVDDRVLVRRLGQALPRFKATVVALNIGRHSGETQQTTGTRCQLVTTS